MLRSQRGRRRGDGGIAAEPDHGKALGYGAGLLANVIDKASQGWFVWLDNDTDLDPLRDIPRFIELVRKAKARFAAQAGARAANRFARL